MEAIILSLFLYLKADGIEPMVSTDTHPEVAFVSQIELNSHRHGAQNVSVLAICDDGKIFLRDDIDLHTVEGRSVLLHELIHYTQNHCPKLKIGVKYFANEHIAYTEQNKYLRENHSGWFVQNPYESPDE